MKVGGSGYLADIAINHLKVLKFYWKVGYTHCLSEAEISVICFLASEGTSTK